MELKNYCVTCANGPLRTPATCNMCTAGSNYVNERELFMATNKREAITVKDVFDRLTDAEKKSMYYLVGAAIEMSETTPTIREVIFNPPATIVFWTDNTKTVVKTRGDEEFDPEKGLAMAISKKTLGNKYDYYHTFKHWTKKYNKTEESKEVE